MKLVTITGKPNTGKDWLARKLGGNSDVLYIRPYSDRKIPKNIEPWEFDDSSIHLSEYKLSKKMEREVPLAIRTIGDTRYVFFRNQLRADYVVIVVDEATLDHLRKNYDCEIYSIYVTHDTCPNSDDYDVVYNPKTDDYDTLEAGIV